MIWLSVDLRGKFEILVELFLLPEDSFQSFLLFEELFIFNEQSEVLYHLADIVLICYKESAISKVAESSLLNLSSSKCLHVYVFLPNYLSHVGIISDAIVKVAIRLAFFVITIYLLQDQEKLDKIIKLNEVRLSTARARLL